MKDDTYAAEAAHEADHWWFVGRRNLFARELARIGCATDARVIDLGTSSGTNLRMLRMAGYSSIVGVDSSSEAVRWCVSKGFGPVIRGDIMRLPFRDAAADLVLATDVLEHVDDDAGAARELARVTRPGGTVLVTVPTFRMLWGLQDEVAEHKRRYRKSELETLLASVGLEVRRAYYFNYLLFLPILAARQMFRLVRPNVRSENEINSPLVNRLLGAIFSLDVATAPLLRPPFGVSALVVAWKPTH